MRSGHCQWRILRGVPAEVAQEFLCSAVRRRFGRKEVLFHHDELGDTMHMVARGLVAVRIGIPSGDVATIAHRGPGDFVGELALLGNGLRRTASVVAVQPTETLAVRREAFESLKARHPEVAVVLIEVLAERVRELSKALVEALYVPAETRLRRRLLELGVLYAGGNGSDGNGTDGAAVNGRSPAKASQEIPLTQDDLAMLVGATRGTVNRVLRSEAAQGVLRTGRGKIELLDLDALAKHAR